MITQGCVLQIRKDKFPVVKLQSCHFKMDNIIGADEFFKGDKFKVIKVDGPDIYLYRNGGTYFIKQDEVDEIFFNLTQERKDKLNKLFGV